MMPDREKVIKGLEGIYRCVSPVTHTCGDCPYQDNHVECKRRVLSDAIALLKEQEQRVLTLDEAAADQEVWTEAKLYGTERIPLFILILWLTDDAKDFELELIGTSKRAFMLSKEYGKTWRCWSSKPTEERRKEVKWE